MREIAAPDPRTIEAVLAFCLAEHHPAAARAAAEILGRIGKAQQACCKAEASRRRWCARCEAPIARLRMAALEAIVGLAAADVPFAGSSHVLESLAYLAASTGGRRALVVSPEHARPWRSGSAC